MNFYLLLHSIITLPGQELMLKAFPVNDLSVTKPENPEGLPEYSEILP